MPLLDKDKILNDNGILIANDVIYYSDNVSWEYNLIKDKVIDFYYKKNISIFVTSYINTATVLIIDKDALGYMWDTELNYVIANNIRIIPFNNFSRAIHTELVLIDEKMYGNLLNMIKSKDEDTLSLACEIMSNSNRTDPECIENLIRLCSEFDSSLFSGISKTSMKSKSPHLSELFNFLETEHYEQYQRYKTGESSSID